MRKSLRFTATALSAAILGIGGTAAFATATTATLIEDGITRHAWGYSPTVAALLSANGVTLADGDQVTPALGETITSGTVVEVKYHRQLKLTIDGETQTLTTTEATLPQALSAAGLPDYTDARYSTPREALLPRGVVAIQITTPKPVTITDGTQKTDLTTTAPDVATLLTEVGHSLTAEVSSYPTPATPVTKGLAIAVGKIATATETKDEAIPFPTETGTSNDLFQGESKVTQKGKEGQVSREYTTVTVNGAAFLTHVTGEKIISEPVPLKVTKGTRVAGSSGQGIDLRRESEWRRIAQCESGNRWNINTGNGYYGGLQFNMQAWTSNGGRDFAPRADLATREQQITVANRYADKAGFRPWSCKP